MNEFVATVTEAVNLASLVRHVVALFEEARQGLESLAYPIDVAISASPSQLSLKSAILYRGLDRAQTHRELSGRPAYARAERWSRYRRRECGGMSVPVRASYGGLLDGTGFSSGGKGPLSSSRPVFVTVCRAPGLSRRSKSCGADPKSF